MQTIIVNLKLLYPEHYKEDMFIEIATEIFEIIDSYEHMESAYDRKLRYHNVEGKSLQVIAKEENCTKQSVFKSISKALDKLRKILEKNGYDVTD